MRIGALAEPRSWDAARKDCDALYRGAAGTLLLKVTKFNIIVLYGLGDGMKKLIMGMAALVLISAPARIGARVWRLGRR